MDSIFSRLPNKAQTLILCDNYGQAGAINFYTTKNLRAVSFNADYINWFDFQTEYKNLIRIKESGETMEELKETSPFFEHAAIADSITNQYAREYGTILFAFTSAKIDLRQRLRDEIQEHKNFR